MLKYGKLTSQLPQISFCGYSNLAVIDSEEVIHTRPVQSNNTIAPIEGKKLYHKRNKYKQAFKVNYGYF